MLLINIHLKVIILSVSLILAGCSIVPSILYQIDVQQGNVITQEMVEKLKPGMTKSQVRFVMGTPLVVDIFRDNRWDYIYVRQEGGELIDKQGIAIFFEEDRLTYIENNSVPISPLESEGISPDPTIFKQND